MVGIDFNKASLKERELFAFSVSQLKHSLQNIYNKEYIKGCVIITTCNRTELWVSEESGSNHNLIDIMCEEKGVYKNQFQRLFISREDSEAILHLFETACGMRSQILGEDQILSQVKSSIDTARENNVANELLEKLFQSAVTSAKKIKSTVHITTADTSVAYAAFVRATEYYNDLTGVKCLIIGNGEMGRLAAELFVKNGADVSITLRNHKNGKNIIPDNCKAVDYEERIQKICDNDIIISATISPHLTIKKDDINFISSIDKKFLFIDLAVPRDIEEEIGQYKNAILIDMDNIGIQLSIDKIALQKANRVIAEHKADFYKWCITRKYLKRINKFAFDGIVEDLKKDIDKLSLNIAEKSNLKNKIIAILQNAI